MLYCFYRVLIFYTLFCRTFVLVTGVRFTGFVFLGIDIGKTGLFRVFKGREELSFGVNGHRVQ